VERRTNGQSRENWERIAKLDANITKYLEAKPQTRQPLSYRIRAANANGESAYSNIATLVLAGVR
jgi:hypothetical protein